MRAVKWLPVLALFLVSLASLGAQTEAPSPQPAAPAAPQPAAPQPAAPQPAAPSAGAAGRQAALLTAPVRPEAKDLLLEDILGTELTAMLGNSQLSVRSRHLALAAGPDQPRLPEEERISRLLAGVDASGVDVIVAAFYLVEGDGLTIQFALYDPAVKVVLGGVLARARKGLTVFASIASAVGEFVPAVKRYVAGGYNVEPPAGLVERIVVSGPQEGSHVVLVDKDFGTVSGGRLVVPYTQFTVGTSIPVRVIKDGYHTYTGTLPLPTPQVNLAIPPLHRETRMDLDLRWSLGFAYGIGLGARFHVIPDSTYVGLEGYRSLEATSFNSNLVRHYDVNAQIGQYIFFPYSSFFRIHVSLGAGVIITNVEGLAGREYTDYYIVVGDPTAEFTVFGVKLFVRPDIHYSLGLGYNLLGREWIRTPYGLPPLTIGAGLSW